MAQLLTGIQMFPAESMEPFCVEDVQKYLKVIESGQRQDLIARNIQRGPDHGIPPYSETCSWNKALNETPGDLWRKLGIVYTHPADIDLFTGGLSEAPSRGSVFGETSSGVFFTHGPGTNENTFDRYQIRNMTRRFGDFLCDNIDVLKEIRENVFELDSLINSCDQKHLLDLKIFLK
ncbi:hypothetical protein TCAL_15337 [Tigriopus californicus]|uniref:Uncharacterized protein n=1 Tax=Tigriopus californicus TaxID=6832 RepID=A0A553PKF8_TIGCA|nr:hypothetical protein TCAL_15337 [Tigriopus californicus]